jgi:drug/metabolite transporter (DMT)-like permease
MASWCCNVMPAKKLSTYIIILLASSAYFLFVAMDTLSKYMTQHIEVHQLVWGRYFFHLIAMLAYFAIFKPKLDLKKNFKVQIVRSVLLVFATFLMFNALKLFTLVDIYVLFFTAPLILALLSAIFLKDNLSLVGWILMGLSFLAIVYTLGPSMKVMSFEIAFAFLIPVCWSLYQFFTKLISNNREPFVAVFYSGLVGSVIFSIYNLSHWNTIESNWIWLGLIILGVFGFISHLILVYTIQLSNLSFVANFQYSQLVWSSILGLLIFGTPIEPTRVLGMVAIIIFGVLFIKFELSKKV